jgi:hypothetical protein
VIRAKATKRLDLRGLKLPDRVSRGRRIALSGRLARVLQRLHSTFRQPVHRRPARSSVIVERVLRSPPCGLTMLRPRSISIPIGLLGGFPRALGADFSAMDLPPQITSRLFVLITADYTARLEIPTRPADVLSSKWLTTTSRISHPCAKAGGGTFRPETCWKSMAYLHRPRLWKTVTFFAVTAGPLYALWGHTDLAAQLVTITANCHVASITVAAPTSQYAASPCFDFSILLSGYARRYIINRGGASQFPSARPRALSLPQSLTIT